MVEGFEGLRRALQSWGTEPSSEEARTGKMVAQAADRELLGYEEVGEPTSGSPPA